jgi:hypothetical protein
MTLTIQAAEHDRKAILEYPMAVESWLPGMRRLSVEKAREAALSEVCACARVCVRVRVCACVCERESVCVCACH